MPADTAGETYDLTYAGSERSFHVIAKLENIAEEDGSLSFTYVAGFGTMTISADAVIDATVTSDPISGIEPV